VQIAAINVRSTPDSRRLNGHFAGRDGPLADMHGRLLTREVLAASQNDIEPKD
jgi:hypothetical protein